MSWISSALVNFGRLASLLQVIFYLPLALDLAGTEAFLALSAALASYYGILSTVRLITRRTKLAWIGDFMAIWQFVVIPLSLIVCFNVYSPPSESYFAHVAKRPSSSESTDAGKGSGSSLFGLRSKGSADASVPSDQGEPGLFGPEVDNALQTIFRASLRAFFFLARNVPRWWFIFLRWSTPIFSLLEGIASVLVIQAMGSMSRWVIAASLARPPSPKKRWLSHLPSFGLGGAEGWQLLFLLLSAFTYVSSAIALYVCFESATRDRPGAAAAVGTSVSSTFWLTAIAFAVRKGNVVETSLMMAYVVFNVVNISDSLAFTADPLALIRSFKVNTESGSPLPLLPAVVGSTKTLIQVGGRIAGQSIDFISAALAALPKSVIVSLVYRLMVLYAASRILPYLSSEASSPPGWARRPNDGTDDEEDEYTDDEDWEEDEKDPQDEKRRRRAGEPRRLSEEEPFGAFIQIIVSYSRLIMIATYSHLLLLDQSNQVYWRFLTVGITLMLWAF